MSKYRVYFMGFVEVEADSRNNASQKAWDKLNMEDDIFTMESINNVVEINQGENLERSVATDGQSE